MPASTAAWIEGPRASASGMETISPSGLEATAASMSWAMATMSKVPGAWYSTVTPMSSAAAMAPFCTTDQKGSEAWPWETMMMRISSCAAAGRMSAPIPVSITTVRTAISLNMRFIGSSGVTAGPGHHRPGA